MLITRNPWYQLLSGQKVGQALRDAIKTKRPGAPSKRSPSPPNPEVDQRKAKAGTTSRQMLSNNSTSAGESIYYGNSRTQQLSSAINNLQQAPPPHANSLMGFPTSHADERITAELLEPTPFNYLHQPHVAELPPMHAAMPQNYNSAPINWFGNVSVAPTSLNSSGDSHAEGLGRFYAIGDSKNRMALGLNEPFGPMMARQNNDTTEGKDRHRGESSSSHAHSSKQDHDISGTNKLGNQRRSGLYSLGSQQGRVGDWLNMQLRDVFADTNAAASDSSHSSSVHEV
jgi:hypothetical protein